MEKILLGKIKKLKYRSIIKIALLSTALLVSVSSYSNVNQSNPSSGGSTKNLSSESSELINDENAFPEKADLSSYINELESMKSNQREVLIMKQELETERLRAELLKLRGGAQRLGASPYIMSLTGKNSNLQARVMVPGFGEMTVRKGDQVPQEWHIIDITNQTVFARQGDKSVVQLPFFSQ